MTLPGVIDDLQSEGVYFIPDSVLTALSHGVLEAGEEMIDNFIAANPDYIFQVSYDLLQRETIIRWKRKYAPIHENKELTKKE